MGVNTVDPANIGVIMSNPLFRDWVTFPITIDVPREFQVLETEANDTWTEFTPAARLTHFLSEDTMVYAGFSSGFKAGGFDVYTDAGVYEPEIVDSYVLGLKTDLLEGTLRINSELFYNEYTDKQLAVIVFLEDSQTLSFSQQNVGEVESWGFESEVTWITPVTGLTFDLNVGYLDTDIKELIDEGVDVAEDRALGFQPELTGMIRGNYGFDMAGGYVFMTADVAYRDEMYTNNFPTDLTSEFSKSVGLSEELTTVNASIAYRTDDEHWRIALEGKNLTDERELVNTFTVEQWTGGGYSPRRSWALSVGYTF